jgi:GAF domain-containing protein
MLKYEGPMVQGARGGIDAYRRLRDVSGELLALRELAPLLKGCDALTQELLHIDACSIVLLNECARTLVPLLTQASGHTTMLEPLSLELFDGRIWESILGGRTIIVAGGLILDGGEALVLAEPQSALTAMLTPLPLAAPRRGVLWVGRIHGEPFTLDDQHLAEAIAALLAFGLRNVCDSAEPDGHKGIYGEAVRGVV